MTVPAAGNGLLKMRFLGVGNAQARSLGSSAAVLEQSGRPLLLIDCGPGVVERYQAQYEALPSALFITHTHFDHIADLEGLFFKARFSSESQALIKLYVPVPVVEQLQRRIADYPGMLAEGGANFWDVFQLIPLSSSFWHAGLQFSCFPVRHHGFQSAFGLSLPGHFLFSGDTRPIPEILTHFAPGTETVFHDCALKGNPSHTGVDDLPLNYSDAQRARLVLYHYESPQTGDRLRELGYRVAGPGDVYVLGGAWPQTPPVPLGGKRVAA